MLYPNTIEQKLGFDTIREIVKTHCLSTLGKHYVEKIRFSSDRQLIEKMLRQTSEFQKLLEQNLPFPQDNYLDLNSYLDRIKPEGSFLDGEECKNLMVFLRTVTGCIDCLDKYETELPELYQLRTTVSLDKDLYYRINAVIDQYGKVKDKASPDLEEIRQHLFYEQQTLRKETDKLLKYYKKENCIDELLEPTIRNGRTVLPIKSEYKRKIKGLIHDESATGQTTFIEPAEIFEINNNIKDLELLEKREVIRILTNLTNHIRSQIPELKKSFQFLGLIDFIRAKALLSIDLKSTTPSIQKENGFEWKEARHPLLYLNFKKVSKDIVPLDIYLTPENRILIISGPNAGGKSVCLKTTGLLQYMLQCGFPVPASEGSSCALFKDIFIDIGDEQSIENDLSTYSAHLSAMNHFLKMCTKNTLILIDEFGTGTEPSIGEAIATAILGELNALQCFGVITTHYSQIKAFAYKTKGLVNGAMSFHIDKMEPLYSLSIGNPGSSFAIEIATKIGLPSAILEKAKQITGDQPLLLDGLIRQIETEKNQLINTTNRLTEKEKQAKERVEKYTRMHSELTEKKNSWLKEAKAEAKEIINEANKKIETIIREIKESKADKSETKKIRQELETYKETLLPKPTETTKYPEEDISDKGPLKVGDYIRVKNTETIGIVASIKDKEAEIRIGNLKSIIKINRLSKISKKEFKENAGIGFISSSDKESFDKNKIIYQKSQHFSPTLDVRGKRGEEAIKMVIEFIDDALLVGAPDLKIIHGKGDGILRKLIRENLKSNKSILNISDEHADRGGDGITLVKI